MISSGKENNTCSNCPVIAGLEVAIEEIERICHPNELHINSDQHQSAIGSARMSMSLLNGLVEKLNCEGPITDGNFITCPHVRTLYDTRQVVEGPNTGTNIRYKNMSKTDVIPDIGQYL